MTDSKIYKAGKTAEEYLRDRYGAHRGHPEWRALEEAFNAGVKAEKDRVAYKRKSLLEHGFLKNPLRGDQK